MIGVGSNLNKNASEFIPRSREYDSMLSKCQKLAKQAKHFNLVKFIPHLMITYMDSAARKFRVTVAAPIKHRRFVKL